MSAKSLDLGKLVIRSIIGPILPGPERLQRISIDLGKYFDVMFSKRAVDEGKGVEPIYPFTVSQTVSKEGKKKLIRTFIIDGATVHLVYNGYDPEFFMEETEARKRYQPMVDTMEQASEGLSSAFA